MAKTFREFLLALSIDPSRGVYRREPDSLKNLYRLSVMTKDSMADRVGSAEQVFTVAGSVMHQFKVVEGDAMVLVAAEVAKDGIVTFIDGHVGMFEPMAALVEGESKSPQ